MSVTILGQHISVIHPSKPRQCKVYKSEQPRARYQARTRTVKEHCGRVLVVCIKLWDNAIFGICVPATHIDVLEMFSVRPCEVKAVGWKLENGEYLWR